ncbi:hypothetical protein YC2023_057415 [Brassica napus]
MRLGWFSFTFLFYNILDENRIQCRCIDTSCMDLETCGPMRAHHSPFTIHQSKPKLLLAPKTLSTTPVHIDIVNRGTTNGKRDGTHVTNRPATTNRETNDSGLAHAGPAAATSAHHSVFLCGSRVPLTTA